MLDEDLLSVLLLHGGINHDLRLMVFDHMEVRGGGLSVNYKVQSRV